MAFKVYPDPPVRPIVVPSSVAIAVAAGSNGAALPQPTINVTNTTGCDPTGGAVLIVRARAGVTSFTTVTYTGLTPTTLTGCGGGTGALATGDGVLPVEPFQQLTGPDNSGAYVKKMFMRVAKFGGTATPAFSLQAGEGAPVELTAFTQGIYRTNQPPSGYIGDAQLLPPAPGSNVYQIEMGFAQDTTETWKLLIRNNDPADREFTFVVGQTANETAQPWIDATQVQLPFNTLVNQTMEQPLTVSNKGTGPFTVTGVSPPLPAEFTLAIPPQFSVQPGQSSPLVVRFTAPGTPPSPDGTISATPSLELLAPGDPGAGTSPGHNRQLALSARTQKLEVVLLLDTSGSMSWDALGKVLPAGSNRSRWSQLVSGANQFLNLLAHFGTTHGSVGIAHFPQSTPGNPASFDIVRPTPIPDRNGIGAIQGQLTAIVPAGGTPLGDGLDRVAATATSYFGTDAVSIAANRRWLILMSDGAHNSGTHNPAEFLPDGPTPLQARKIELFAVAYGIPGHTDVDDVLLKNLADGSFDSNLDGGQIRKVQVEDLSASDLAKALRDTLTAGLTAAVSPLEPNGVFRFDRFEVRHQAVISQHDTKTSFMLSWNTPDSGRLRLELLTPTCELITPENAGTSSGFPEIAFRGGDRFQMYLIDPEFLQNPANPGTPRYGTWTLVIRRPSIINISDVEVDAAAAVDVEHYGYDVIVDSTLQLRLTTDRTTYFAGDPIGVSAHLTAAGSPVTGASVLLSTTAPTQSVANWVTGLDVPATALQQAEAQLAGQDSTPLLVKTLGAQLAGLQFPGGRRQVDLPMTDPDGTGVYRATFTDTATPEEHTLYVTATGVDDDGTSFRRDAKVTAFVLVQPDPAATVVDISFGAPGQAVVTVIPRDRFGNVLLVDPVTAAGFGPVVKNAQFTGPLTSNLDGTYSRPISFDPGKDPAVGIEFGGKDVIEPRPLSPVGDLHYVDRVVRFEQGAIESANQHADPEAALGSVVQKPAGQFVSLGAGGVLTVGFQNGVVRAAADDDVTVFVHRDADLRSYRVEARVAERGIGSGRDDERRWVPLGESIGVTQSFGLRQAGLSIVEAVRVVDTSLRTRGSDLQPLETPGVSIRGVGAIDLAPVSPSSGFAIQGRFHTKGNFEVVVPLASGELAHFWRDNDHPSLAWHGPTIFGSGNHYQAVALIQSNFSTAGNGPGNLELLAQAGDRLDFYWRDDVNPFPWHGPFAIPGATGLG
jgi:uncharacterized protein YegL